MSYLARLLPPWPVVPPRLWLTTAVVALAGLNLLFEAEIWSHTPRAARCWENVLVLSLVVAIVQVVMLLWEWPTRYTGPQWASWLFRLGTLSIIGPLLLLEIVLTIWSLSLLSSLIG